MVPSAGSWAQAQSSTDCWTVAARTLVAAHYRMAAVCTLVVRYTTVYRLHRIAAILHTVEVLLHTVEVLLHTVEVLLHRGVAAPHRKESRFLAEVANSVQADIFRQPVLAVQHHFEWGCMPSPHCWSLKGHIHSELLPNHSLDYRSPLAVRFAPIQNYMKM